MTFKGLKDGVYAIAIIHDENTNGKLDTNFIGIPAEGVAFPPIRGCSANRTSSRGSSASRATPRLPS